MRSFILACLFTLAVLTPRAWSATPSTPCIIDGQITPGADNQGHPYLTDAFTQQMISDTNDKTEVGIYCTVHSDKYDLSHRPFYQITNLTITRDGVETSDLHVIDVTYIAGDNSPYPSAYIEISARFFPLVKSTGTSPYILSARLLMYDAKK